MQNFWLIMMMAYNLFHAFFSRNLKSIVRQVTHYADVVKMILAELYAEYKLRAVDSS
ncbi:MAG: hypothetical protein HY037_04800 [Nitrospirae bacterium]|nr:hypothetical protein [Candidatus Troglogloeales bacterium]